MSDNVTKALDDFHTITPHLTVRGAEAPWHFIARRSAQPSSIMTCKLTGDCKRTKGAYR